MLACANVFHFFAHEFARLSAGRLALAFVPARPFDRLLLWHVCVSDDGCKLTGSSWKVCRSPAAPACRSTPTKQNVSPAQYADTVLLALDRPMMKSKLHAALTCASALLITQICFAGGGMHPEVADHGMVASVHELASRAGVEMMQAGGNAIDAAVATGFALAVVHPSAGNLGGGGFMLIRMHDGASPEAPWASHFIDFRETAPGKATATMYLDAQGNVIPKMSTVGYKAVGVPGSVKGLVYAEQHFGKLGLERVIAPAIRLAREGYA